MSFNIPGTDLDVERHPRPAPMAALTAEGKEAAKNFSGSDPQSRVLFRLKEGPATAATLAGDPIVSLDKSQVSAVLNNLEREGYVYRIARERM